MRVLSVDLGTSNTVAVLSAHGRRPVVVEVDGSATMPSAVFAAPDGSLIVGREAVRRARTEPARFEPNPKRRIDEGTLLLGDRVITVTEALSAVLGRVNAEVTRQLGGAAPDEVRLTHPAQWGPLRRNALLSAARQAGMPRNLMLIPEPVAAAAHFASFPGQSVPPGMALVVYDLGAGTFDVGIVAAQQQGFTVLAEAGLPDLGGLDVDHALLTHIGRQESGRDPAGWQRLLRPDSADDRRAARLLQEDVRAAKEALSAHPQTEVALPEPFADVLVTRAELEAAIRPKLADSIRLLATTMNAAGLTPANLAGVYLVGGSSRIPLVAKMITEHLRLVPTGLDSPETAVALGAHLLPRAGTTMRTDAMPPPSPSLQSSLPSSPPLPPPVLAGQVDQSPVVKRHRIGWAAAVAVLAAAALAVTLVVWKPWDTGQPLPTAAPVKFDAAKLAGCKNLAALFTDAKVERATSEQTDKNTKIDCGVSGRLIDGHLTDNVGVLMMVHPPRSAAGDGNAVARKTFDAYTDAPPTQPLTGGQAVRSRGSFADCSGSFVVLDGNVVFLISYITLTEDNHPPDCEGRAREFTQQVVDLEQPK